MKIVRYLSLFVLLLVLVFAPRARAQSNPANPVSGEAIVTPVFLNTSGQVLTAQNWYVISASVGGPSTYTLPSSGVQTGGLVQIKNQSPGIATIVGTIFGSKSLPYVFLQPGQFISFMWDGNYWDTSNYPQSAVDFQTGSLTGTAYTLTAVNALAAGGTTNPTVTIQATGRYLIWYQANILHNGATYAANQTITLSLFRSNDQVGLLAGTSTVTNTGIITTLTSMGGTPTSVPAIVNCAAGDIISVYAIVSVTPSAGSTTITSANVVAVPWP
jgi:hypothetical protein